MTESEPIDTHVQQIRSSEVLGRSDQLHRLFDYLVECTRAGKTPKESVIAIEVFGRSSDFDVSQDAGVRVYIHKLRRKFEEFYATHPQMGPERLTIPKGEYRLVLEAAPVVVAEAPVLLPVPPPAARNPWKLATFGSVAALVLLAVLAGALWQRTPERQFSAIHNSPVWSKLVAGTRPITVVLGDYYIFAETGDMAEPKRLVREFFINSRTDLDQYLMEHPDMMDRYMDVQLGYLPTASAQVMADIMPVLAATHRPVRVTMMSDLVPEDLKSSDVVYVGYLSGLGMLYDGTFAGSRFSVGSTFDELTDKRTAKHYITQAGDRYLDGSQSSGPSMYRDYSFVTEFQGPSGNQVLIIAGMRDVGLEQAGGAVTDRASLHQLAGSVKGGAFEALYEVTGINSTGMGSTLLVSSSRATGTGWDRVSPAPDRLGSVETPAVSKR